MAKNVWWCGNCGYEVTSSGRCGTCGQSLSPSPLLQLVSSGSDAEFTFHLHEWDARSIGLLIEGLLNADIEHRFEGRDLIVRSVDETRVDAVIAPLVGKEGEVAPVGAPKPAGWSPQPTGWSSALPRNPQGPPRELQPLEQRSAARASKRRRHRGARIIFIVGLAFCVAVIVAVSLANNTPPVGNSTAGTSAAQSSTTPGIGQVAEDGDFAFVVRSLSCGAGAAAAVSGGLGEAIPAGAQECLVTMTVTADKGTGQTFFATNQYAYDAAGRQFGADETGALNINNSNDDTQVNPGITITAIVPFQIPSTDQILKLELHDSAFSGGVAVNV